MGMARREPRGGNYGTGTAVLSSDEFPFHPGMLRANTGEIHIVLRRTKEMDEGKKKLISLIGSLQDGEMLTVVPQAPEQQRNTRFGEMYQALTAQDRKKD